jgi:hypothetical protein
MFQMTELLNTTSNCHVHLREAQVSQMPSTLNSGKNLNRKEAKTKKIKMILRQYSAILQQTASLGRSVKLFLSG